MDFGWLKHGVVTRERDHRCDRIEAFIDQIQTPAVMRVVELADGLFFRLLQLWKRRPLEEELAGQRGKEILAGQSQRLGIVALERVAEHVREQGAQIDRAAALFQQTGQGAGLRIVWEPGSEFVAVMEEQLEADLRIGGIALGPAGFKGLAVASGGGRVDRVEHEEGISQEGGDEGSFGLLQAEGNLPLGETLFQRAGPLRDRFWSVLKGGASRWPVVQS